MRFLVSLLVWLLRAVPTSRRSLALEPRSSATARGLHPNPEAASAQNRGEGVLGRALKGLAGLALGPASGQASHRDCVATRLRRR